MTFPLLGYAALGYVLGNQGGGSAGSLFVWLCTFAALSWISSRRVGLAVTVSFLLLGAAAARSESSKERSANQSLVQLFSSSKHSQCQGEGRVVKMALSTAGKPSTVFILNPLVMDNGYYRTKISFPFPVRVVGNAPSVVLGDWVSFGNLMHSRTPTGEPNSRIM